MTYTRNILEHSVTFNKSIPETMECIEYTVLFHDQMMHLHRSAMEAACAYKGEGPWDDDLRDIPNVYCSNRGCFLFIVENKTLVAMGAYRYVDENTAEIKRMRVLPSMQGKGIGGFLLAELERRAREEGYTNLILETSLIQEKANRLYFSRGYVKERNEVIDGYASTWYRKTLVQHG
jgi:GNAT superfamily N-acetyltransferase